MLVAVQASSLGLYLPPVLKTLKPDPPQTNGQRHSYRACQYESTKCVIRETNHGSHITGVSHSFAQVTASHHISRSATAAQSRAATGMI